jgi:hypothetical protein
MTEGDDDPGKCFAEGLFAPDLAMIKEFVRYYIDSSRGQLSLRPVISSGLKDSVRSKRHDRDLPCKSLYYGYQWMVLLTNAC